MAGGERLVRTALPRAQSAPRGPSRHGPGLSRDTDREGEETIRDYLPVDRTDTPAAELRRLLAGGWDALKFGKLDDGEELEEWERSFEFCVSFGNNLGLCDAARENVHAFWKNLSIVIGIPLPPTIEQKSWFACSC